LRSWNMKFFLRVCVAAVPTLLLFLHYYFTKEILTFSSSGLIQAGYFETMWHMVRYFPAVVMPFHRIKYVYEPAGLAELVNYVFAFILFVAALVYVVRVLVTRERSTQSIMGMIAIILVVISPPYLGGLFFLGERFVYLWWLILVAYFFQRYPTPIMRRSIVVGSFLLVALTVGSIWYSTSLYNEMDISATSGRVIYNDRGGSDPFEHFHFYEDIEKDRAVPVFHSGLLDHTGAENTKPF
jgi:hypothetical protein